MAKIIKEFRYSMKELEHYLNDEEGCWTLKGFIDIAKNVYSITSDTKLISKEINPFTIPNFDYVVNKENLPASSFRTDDWKD